MTNNTEQIRAFIEAGENATQGKWYKYDGLNGGSDVLLPEPDKGGVTIHKDCNPINNAQFITQAANSRQAIAEMLADNERMRDSLEKIAERGRERYMEQVNETYEQALANYKKVRDECSR